MARPNYINRRNILSSCLRFGGKRRVVASLTPLLSERVKKKERRHLPQKVFTIGLQNPRAARSVIESRLTERTPNLNSRTRKQLAEQVVPALRTAETWRKWSHRGLLTLPFLALLSTGIYYKYFWGETFREQKLANLEKQFTSEPHFSALDKNPDQPLSPMPAPNEFAPLEIEIDPSSPPKQPPTTTLYINLPAERTGREIERLALTLPSLQLAEETMMPSDPKVLPEFNPKDEKSPSKTATELENVHLGISNSYASIYGIPVKELPEALKGKTINIGVLAGQRGKPVSMMQRSSVVFSAIFYNSRASVPFTFYLLPGLPMRTDYNLEAMRPAYSYVNHFAADLDAAAALIKKHHPELHLDNLRIMLRDDLLVEQSALDDVDLWQDAGACAAMDCPQEESFEKESDKHPIGYPLWAWSLASWTKKYDLSRQAIGPSQIIIGLAKNAGSSKDISGDYLSELSATDIESEDALVAAALDPQKAIYLRAMMLDYMLQQVKSTIYSDERIQHPADLPPYISNPDTAREYGLLNLAYQLLVYPDMDFFAVPLLGRGPNGYFLRQYATGRLFGIEPKYPGLFFVSVNAKKKRSVYFHYAAIER